MTLTAPRSTSSGYNSLYLSLLIRLQSECASVAAPHYDAAIESLQRCPVPYRSVDALTPLEGFSAGIKRKLSVLVREGGGEEAMERQRKEETRRKRGRRSLVECLEDEERRGRVGEQGVRDGVRDGVQPESQHTAEPTTTTKRKSKHTQAPKQYTPTERSGAWGLLVGLYLLSTEDADANDTTYHTKDTLICKAQKYSRASYSYCPTRSAGGAKFVTAWSSMKILLKRELVWQRGRPMTFGLSEAGWEVARRCACVEGVNVDEGGDGDEVVQGGDGDEVVQGVDTSGGDGNEVVQRVDTVAEELLRPATRAPTLLQLLEESERGGGGEEEEEREDHTSPLPPVPPRKQLFLPPKSTRKGLYLPAKTGVGAGVGVETVLQPACAPNVDRPTPARTLPTLFLPTKKSSAGAKAKNLLPQGKENARSCVEVEVIVIDDDDD